MKTIHKYPLDLRDPNQFGFAEIAIPRTATVLSAIVQYNDVVVYASLKTTNVSEVEDKIKPRKIYIAGTGKELPEDVDCFYDFIGTVIQGIYVWHIYAEPAENL
jgi:hypothetical protein